MRKLEDTRLAIVGFGHVGQLLATGFGKCRDTLGFDINQARRPDPAPPVNAGQGAETGRRRVRSMNSRSSEADMFSSAQGDLELE